MPKTYQPTTATAGSHSPEPRPRSLQTPSKPTSHPKRPLTVQRAVTATSASKTGRAGSASEQEQGCGEWEGRCEKAIQQEQEQEQKPSALAPAPPRWPFLSRTRNPSPRRRHDEGEGRGRDLSPPKRSSVRNKDQGPGESRAAEKQVGHERCASFVSRLFHFQVS
jgi:hypothetical protein